MLDFFFLNVLLTVYLDFSSLLSFKTDNCTQELIRFFTKSTSGKNVAVLLIFEVYSVASKTFSSAANVTVLEKWSSLRYYNGRENPTVVLLVGIHTTATQLWQIKNI